MPENGSASMVGGWRNSSGIRLRCDELGLPVISDEPQRCGERVLFHSQDPVQLIPMILTGWAGHQPLAIAPPGQDPDLCARVLGAATPRLKNDGERESVAAEEDAPAPGLEHQVAAIIFSSGSTGVPKGVRHSMGSLVGSARLFLDHFQIHAGETIVCLAAPHVMSGFRALLLPLIGGVSVVFLHDSSATGLKLVLRALEADWVICGPHFVKLLAACTPWLGDLEKHPKAILVTGDRLDEVSREQVMSALSIPVVAYYGLTETGGIVMAERPGFPEIGRLPPACEGVTLHTRRAAELPGKVELGIEGPNNYLGYCGQPVLRHEVVWTGDCVEEVEPGGFRWMGRLDHAIKAPDTTWVFPENLERWLREQSCILDAVVKPAKEGGVLECWVDWEGVPELLLDEIEANLGRNYRPTTVHRARIERSQLGKLNRVIPR